MSDVSSKYARMSSHRNGYLNRARKCALVTIPALYPPEGFSEGDELPTPYQGTGARGVNNLASKLLLALLPPTAPFFRAKPDAAALAELGEDEEAKSEIEKALSQYERIVMDDIESSGDRVVIFEALKHLVVGGNVLLYIAKGALKMFRLDRFVVRRDPMGMPIEIIVKESFDPDALPEEVAETLNQTSDAAPMDAREDEKSSEKVIDVYTHIRLEGETWFAHQEVMGQIIESSKSSYPKDKSPWQPLRLVRVDGEDYGRGYVEEYLGDLTSLEGLSQAIIDGSAAAARVLFLVKPNSTTRASVLAESPNAAIREGNADDVTVVQVDKFADFRTARETMNRIEDRLSQAFLITGAVVRDAERVTAEEIRLMAQELDSALGGVFSTLTQEFQVPYVKRRIALLERAGKLPRIEKNIRIQIITGLDALGRSQDGNRLIAFITALANTVGPQQIAQRLNFTEFATRLAASEGIDPEGLLRSEEEVATEMNQAKQDAMMQKMAPNLVNKGAELIQSNQGNTDGQP